MAHEEPAAAASASASASSPSASASSTPPQQPHAAEPRPRNRIQVSREKRPLYFFIGLAKKFLLSEDEVELSGLGLAVTTVVTVAEILKNSGHVTISKIATSLVDMQADGRSSMPKAKIQIWIRKSAEFDHLITYVDNTKKQTVTPARTSAPTTTAATAEPAPTAAASAGAAQPAEQSAPPPAKSAAPAAAPTAESSALAN